MGKKQHNIRWCESDKNELRRAIKNYNARLAYFAKKHPNDIEAMPARKRVADIAGDIKTRGDFNKALRALQTIDKDVMHTSRGGYMTIGDYKEKYKDFYDDVKIPVDYIKEDW